MSPDKRTKYVFNCKSFKSALTLIFVAILEYQIMIFLKNLTKHMCCLIEPPETWPIGIVWLGCDEQRRKELFFHESWGWHLRILTIQQVPLWSLSSNSKHVCRSCCMNNGCARTSGSALVFREKAWPPSLQLPFFPLGEQQGSMGDINSP